MLDRLPRDSRHVDVTLGRNLARDHANTGGYQGFASYAAVWILLEHGIEHRIRNLVRDLVRMPLRDGFGREYVPLSV
jgi:hypothetical protein